MYWAQGHNRAAIDHLLPALNLTRQAQWLEGESTVLGNLGAAYGNMGQLATSAEYTTQALSIDRRLGSKSGQARPDACVAPTNSVRVGRVQLTCQAPGQAAGSFNITLDIKDRDHLTVSGDASYFFIPLNGSYVRCPNADACR